MQKKKNLFLQGLIVTLSKMAILSDFILNMIFFIYIFATLWEFS